MGQEFAANNNHHGHGHGPKIEAGQILNPDCFPPPNELVCIQVPKVFDQVALRDCILRTVHLKHRGGEHCSCSHLPFEGVTDFDIVEVKVVSKTDSLTRPGYKKIKLFVKIRYNINYTDGNNSYVQCDEATFNLTINEIYCPSCIAQIGVIKSHDDLYPTKTLDPDGTLIKVEALAEAFNDNLNPETGLLSFDIGVFFIIKCECVVQLLIPAYGYCPVPPEQINPAVQNCRTFNDRTRTPFPNQFFPDQKWNPLDTRE